MSWTDERVETLKTMWSEGKSASQIAKELGGVTRNAVIGKVHRLGLSNRVGGEHPDDLGAPAEAILDDETPAPTPEAATPQPATAPNRPARPRIRPRRSAPSRPARCHRSPRPPRSARRPWPISPRSRKKPAVSI